MALDKFSIHILKQDKQDQIVALRRQAYELKYKKEVLDPDLLGWNSVDDISLHYVLIENESQNVISTLRLTISDDLEIFKKIMLHPFETDQWNIPYAILSRAATDPKYNGQTLNFKLRHKAIVDVFEKGLSENVFGLVANDVQRLNALKKMGYAAFTNPHPWGGCIKRPENSSLIVRLQKQNYINEQSHAY